MLSELLEIKKLIFQLISSFVRFVDLVSTKDETSLRLIFLEKERLLFVWHLMGAKIEELLVCENLQEACNKLFNLN
jgi:hypothetical protein